MAFTGLILTFKESATPTYGVSNQPLAFKKIANIPKSQALFIRRILCKHIFKLLWIESSFSVVRVAVTSVLVLVNITSVYTKERVGQETVQRGVEEVAVNDHNSYCGEYDVESEFVKASERIHRPNDAIVVLNFVSLPGM